MMHARHLLGMLAIVRFQNSFKFSRPVRSQGVPLNIVPSRIAFSHPWSLIPSDTYLFCKRTVKLSVLRKVKIELQYEED